MKHFRKITEGMDVSRLVGQLDDHDELWDEYTFRTTVKGGPFQGTSDLWVRYRAMHELTAPRHFAEPHLPVWYPGVGRIPAVRTVCLDLLAMCRAEILGGVLITRVPPHGCILPHHDRGSWHAEFYNLKVYVPLHSNAGCVNICENERVSMQVGEVWSFNNLETHSVENSGDTDRVTLIVCMRKDDP